MPRRLLILGGTAEAAALARALPQRFGARIVAIIALAGRTEHPGPLPGEVRIGGFGGTEGLASYLNSAGIDLLIDATHPFADRIALHARLAADAARVPRLVLERPPWRRHPLDRWIEVETLEGAAPAVGRLGRRCFLTVGASDLAPFAGARGVHFVVRLIDPPRVPPPLASHEIVLGRGPFALAEEELLLRRHRIDVVAAKASGGSATEAKLIAARQASLPVVMLRRPKPEPGPRVANVEDALLWLARAIEGSAPKTVEVAGP
ncbi:MAG TPA: cobalt-precorrin-6A reductase [Stellaceae bacterium]|nr:cobalt-precorrin-6A reductase [Stellaceae bacterium]